MLVCSTGNHPLHSSEVATEPRKRNYSPMERRKDHRGLEHTSSLPAHHLPLQWMLMGNGWLAERTCFLDVQHLPMQKVHKSECAVAERPGSLLDQHGAESVFERDCIWSLCCSCYDSLIHWRNDLLQHVDAHSG